MIFGNRIGIQWSMVFCCVAVALGAIRPDATSSTTRPTADEMRVNADLPHGRPCRVVDGELGRFRLEEVVFSEDPRLRTSGVENLRLKISGRFRNTSEKRLHIFRLPDPVINHVSFWPVGDQSVYYLELNPGVHIHATDVGHISEIPPQGQKEVNMDFPVWMLLPETPLETVTFLRFAKVKTDSLRSGTPEYVQQLPAGTYAVRCDLELVLHPEQGADDVVTIPSVNMLWITVHGQSGRSVAVMSHSTGESETRPSD